MTDIDLTNLTTKQREAFYYMKSGKNVFLTGPAGTGKSFLLNYFIYWYNIYEEDSKSKQSLYITSTTGLSSLLINGMTIHRYAGIGIGDKDIEVYYKKIIKLKHLKNRWLYTKVLIIDEISMMNPELFDKLEILARKVRKSTKPFGGIQIILSGDFLQLPPINSESFCFEAFSWNIIDKTYYFDEIVRQNNVTFQSVLNKIRLGIIDNDVKRILDERLNKELIIDDGIIPTLLFSRKNMVTSYNQTEIDRLINDGKINYIYDAIYEIKKRKDDIVPEQNYRDLINSQYQVEDKVLLSLHSQVMLTINLPEYKLANGSKGIIIDFTNDELHLPIVLFTNKVTLIIKYHNYTIDEDGTSIIKSQIPLILSWAITIHKAQGMTLDYIKTDIGNSIFEYGQVYVVLSRIKSLEGLTLMNINYSTIKAHPKIVDYYNKLK